MITKEKLAFTKMKPICELEERHGADLGPEFQSINQSINIIRMLKSPVLGVVLYIQ